MQIMATTALQSCCMAHQTQHNGLQRHLSLSLPCHRPSTFTENLLCWGAVGGAGGLVLLFHGASGVGKTMMANAVAKHVGRKVLLINFPSLGSNEAGTAIRFIFRYVAALPCPALPYLVMPCPMFPCPATPDLAVHRGHLYIGAPTVYLISCWLELVSETSRSASHVSCCLGEGRCKVCAGRRKAQPLAQQAAAIYTRCWLLLLPKHASTVGL